MELKRQRRLLKITAIGERLFKAIAIGERLNSTPVKEKATELLSTG